MADRPVLAPAWLAERIKARANAAIPNAQVAFGDVEFVVNSGWRPRVRIADLQVLDQQGVEIIKFAQAEAALAMRSLLEGQPKPKSIDLSGVFATLIRFEDGSVALRGGEDLTGSAQQSAATLPELIEQLDRAFEQPALSTLISADVQALTLRYEDKRIGEVWVVDGGRLRLDRDGTDLNLSADLALLSGGAEVATLEVNYASRLGDIQAEFGAIVNGVRAHDLATQSPALAWLDALRAPISGSLRSGVDSDGALSPLSATLQIGAGVLQPTEETTPIPFDSARSYFSYDPQTQSIDFAELSLVSKWVTARAEGVAFLGGLETGVLQDLVGQFRLTDLSLNPFEVYDAPVKLAAADADFRLTLDPFAIHLGQMQIRDVNNALSVSGRLSAQADGWRYALDGQMDAITPARLLELWPAKAAAPTRNWLVANLKKGKLSDLDVALRGAPEQPINTYFSFEYDEATVRYSPNLPQVENARGQASMIDNRFVVAVNSGHVTPPQGGRIDVAGSSFIIPDILVRGGPPAVARLRTNGTVTAALSLLNLAPLDVMDEAGLPVTLADGRAALEGTVSLPLKAGLKTSDIAYSVAGQLQNVTTDQLVPGQTLASERLSLKASNDGVEIGGQGRLGSVPFDAVWAQPLGVEGGSGSTVRGTVELSERTIDQFNIGLPPGTVSGKGIAQIAVDLPRGGTPQLRLTSNLRGLRMALAPIGWTKSANAVGKLELAAALGNPVQVNQLVLDAPGLAASGTVRLKANGGLDRVTFDRVRVGQWLNAPVSLVGQGQNAPVRIDVTGGTLDLRTAAFGSGGGGGGGQSGPVTLALDRLQITDSIALTGMQGSFKTQGGLDGSFTGRVNGGAAIKGQVLPQNGRSAVRVQGDDAGNIFASAGVLKQARGGSLSLTLLPVGKDGAFDGKLDVKSTRIQDAPAIAALLNALSIVGLLEQLGGSGIHFNSVEAAFRLTPSTMTLTQGSAVGPSMGISMDGIYAVDTGRLDMRGVVSPIYLLNGIGSILTRKGEGLIGFNYTLSGDAKSPKVQVNPLSALTPGMFRNIFRGPAPTVDGQAPTPAPVRDRDLEGATR